MAYVSGCVTGIYISPRAQMAETHAYAYGLDIQNRAKYDLLRAQQEKSCAEGKVSLTIQLEEFESACTQQAAAVAAKTLRQMAATQLVTEEQAIAYSAQIQGLREQMRAHGIRPRLVTP